MGITICINGIDLSVNCGKMFKIGNLVVDTDLWALIPDLYWPFGWFE